MALAIAKALDEGKPGRVLEWRAQVGDSGGVRKSCEALVQLDIF